MTTFNMMIEAIEDDLDDTNNEYLLQIRRAIFAAIRFCERENFYFNQARDAVFKTISGQAWYGEKDCLDIATAAGITALYCQRQNGTFFLLNKATLEELEVQDNPTTRGWPRQYCYFEQKIRLYPRPHNDGNLLRLQLVPKRFEMIDDLDAPHPWFTQAFDLIFARAKYEIYKNILKDAPQALTAFSDFQEQLHALRIETSRRYGGGLIQATAF